MKKLLLVLGLMVSAATAAYCATPIYNQFQLANMNLSGDYELAANINLTGAWSPKGNSSTPFTGSFNGNGHTINGLTIGGAADIGLFGVTDGATIENLIIDNAAVGGDCTADIENAGILAGQAIDTTISNVSVEGVICGVSKIGGLVGYANGGTITNTAAYVAVSTYETVNLDNSDLIGGLVGQADTTVISKSFVHGDVNAETSKVIGGLVGEVIGADAFSNYFEGDIIGTGNVGGLIGRTYGAVYDSYTKTNVSVMLTSSPAPSGGMVILSVLAEGTGSGVVGYLSGSYARVYNTYAVSDVVQGYQAGGIAGVINTGYTADPTKTVYCNAALVDEIRAIKNPAKPGEATIYKVFNNQGSSTPVYGQSNWSKDGMALNEDSFPYTVKITDAYSEGTAVAPANYVSLFNSYMSACGFNDNEVWNDATTEEPYPTLIDVGPSFD